MSVYCFFILLLQCIFMLLPLYISAQDVQVCMQDMGCVKGLTMAGIDGHETFEAFLGIPYAKPPIGMLRLKNPEPVESWSPETIDATKKREDCIQKNYFMPGFPIWGLEDCLYINLYRPKVSSATPLPVIFYIHGGGFFSGGANPKYLGPEYFMANKGIILVTVYYRLGPFGFLSTNDTNMPGNFGLKDQNMALRWVQRHIASFGGDPNLVTLMGHSAGASSVNYHILSSASDGLFHRAVAISATSLSPFSEPLENPEKQVRAIAKAAGIENEHEYCTKGLTKALQDMDAHTLLNAGDVFKILHTLPLVNFRPVIEQSDWENAFVIEHPVETLRRDDYKTIPTILGVLSSKGEGAVFALGIIETEAIRNELNAHFDDYLINMLDFPSTKSTEAIRNDIELLVDEYMHGVHEINNETADGFSELFGDVNFFYPMFEYLQFTLEKSVPTYVYEFNYRDKYSVSMLYAGNDKNFGAVHYDDYLYLFNSPLVFPVLETISTEGMHFIHDYVREFVEFAKTGKPPSFEEAGKCTADNFKAGIAKGDAICNYLVFSNQEGTNGGYKKMINNDFNIKRMKLLAETIRKR